MNSGNENNDAPETSKINDKKRRKFKRKYNQPQPQKLRKNKRRIVDNFSMGNESRDFEEFIGDLVDTIVTENGENEDFIEANEVENRGIFEDNNEVFETVDTIVNDEGEENNNSNIPT